MLKIFLVETINTKVIAGVELQRFAVKTEKLKKEVNIIYTLKSISQPIPETEKNLKA
ncbi:MAG: hypothetical protein QM613_02815 [Micrococcaceae bacterium]